MEKKCEGYLKPEEVEFYEPLKDSVLNDRMDYRHSYKCRSCGNYLIDGEKYCCGDC
tara:strand:+ start:14 stop:181 length:168 start_codon:yes stop_codon:yes gene_type:complete